MELEQKSTQDQIIELLDSISLHQTFLKSNKEALDRYWVNPHLEKFNNSNQTTLNPDADTDTNTDLKNQIYQSIKQIDLNLCQIINLVNTNQIFNQILNCLTWSDFQQLIIINMGKLEFIFGIPEHIYPQISNFLDTDFFNVFSISKNFIIQFKEIFNYTFLDLITDELLTQLIHTCLHIKKIYLAHNYTNEN
jgi:hypothetical protein